MNSNKVHGKDCVHLNIDFYQDFYNAIRMNDDEYITKYFAENSRDGAAVQLQYGHFVFADLGHPTEAQQCHDVQLPLALAVLSGATKAITALLQAGVCPKQVVCNGGNVLHSLIAFLFYNPELEEAIIPHVHFLFESLSVHELREILHLENSYGLRPLEFASQHGQGHMIIMIMNIPDLYLTKQETRGLFTYKWYDITEYETTGNASRWAKSPLRLLTYIDSKMADYPGCNALAEFNVITQWFDYKYRVNLPLIIVWFIIRLSFVVSFMVIDMDMSPIANMAQNTTACVPDDPLLLKQKHRLGLTIYLVVIAFIAIVTDVIEIGMNLQKSEWPLRHTIGGRKSVMCQSLVYIYSHFVMSLLTIVCAPIMCFVTSSNAGTDILDYARIINPLLATWSLLYFFQLIPSIGFFILSIYAMMIELVHFMIVLVLMVIPFIQSFYNFVNANSNQGCIDGFGSVLDVFYSLFMVMLNMVNLASYDLHNIGLLYITHIIFIFTIAIMLINFFVAVMANAVSNLSRHQDKCMYIQRASVAFQVERRLKWLLKFYYRRLTSRYFVCEEGKIYIVSQQCMISLNSKQDVKCIN